MSTNTQPKLGTHTVDADGVSVGRVAAAVVLLLRGKQKPTFAPHRDEGDAVTVVNAAKMKFTGRKFVQKDYYRHSMHPGGLKRTPMQRVFEKNPGLVVRHAVYGMLPKNRQREELMKRLIVKD